MDRHGVRYKIQTDEFVTDGKIKDFIDRFDHILVHFDVDVLDEKLFHSTYFANPELTGDGSGGGRMTMEKLGEIFELISSCGDVAGLTSLFFFFCDGPSSVGFTKSMFCGLSRALQKSFLYFIWRD